MLCNEIKTRGIKKLTNSDSGNTYAGSFFYYWTAGFVVGF